MGQISVDFSAEVARINNGWIVRIRGNNNKLVYCELPEDVGKAVAAALVDERMNGPINEQAEQAQEAPRTALRIKTPKLTDPLMGAEQFGTITISNNTR